MFEGTESAINAKELQIKFNQAVKESTVVQADGTLVDNVITISAIDGAVAVNANASGANLSADGKTLTVTADTTFNGKYVVGLVADKVLLTDGKTAVNEFTSEVLNFKDEVRPTLVNVTTPINGVATFTFSEPLNTTSAAIESAMTITDPTTGNTVATGGLVTLSTDKKSFDLNIAGFALDKNYNVSVAGLADYAGLLISPNPITSVVKRTVVDNVAPTVNNLEAVKTGELKITLSEKVQADAAGVVGTYKIGTGLVTNIDVTAGNATVDASGKVITVTDAGFTGVQSVEVAGFKDLSNNTSATTTKVLQFNADTAAPLYVSHELKAISNVQYLVVKYNETVTANNAAGDITYSYVDANQVTKSGTITNNATNVTAHDADGDGNNESLKVVLTGLANGAYNFTLPAELALDTAATPNKSASKTVAASVGSLSDSGKPTILDGDANPANGYSGISVQATEDTVVVDFSEPVSAATALNVANYTVEGVQVFESAIFDGVQTKVKLTLKDGSIGVTGLRNFNIANIADVAGNTMTAVTTQVNFVENIKPAITAAKLTGASEITVTFSEAVLATSLTDNDDFTVKVDGVANVVTGVTAGAAGTNSFKLALTNAVTDLTKPIALTVVAGNDVVDTTTPGNKLSTTGTLTVTQ